MTPLEILTVARDIVSQDGWWGKDSLCNSDGRVCANGALIVAAVVGNTPVLRKNNWEAMNSVFHRFPCALIEDWRFNHQDELADGLEAATMLLGRAIGDDRVADANDAQTEIWKFNDNYGDDELPDLETTQADVVQAFDYAIKFAAEV